MYPVWHWLDNVPPVTTPASNFRFWRLRVSGLNTYGPNCIQNVLGRASLRIRVTTKSQIVLVPMVHLFCALVLFLQLSVASIQTCWSLAVIRTFHPHTVSCLRSTRKITTQYPMGFSEMVCHGFVFLENLNGYLHVSWYLATSYAGLCLDSYPAYWAASAVPMKDHVWVWGSELSLDHIFRKSVCMWKVYV